MEEHVLRRWAPPQRPKAAPKRAAIDARNACQFGGGLEPVDWDEMEPATILPSQWRVPCRLCQCGCTALALAVLMNAYSALHQKISGLRSEKTRQQARDWFMQPDLDVIMNLRDCCEALGLDPANVRRRGLPVIRRAAGR